MLIIRAPGPPPRKLGKEETCLVASQAYSIAVFVYNRRPVPLARAAARLATCIHAHFYLGHSLLPHLSGLVLTMYDRIPLT